MHAEPVKVPSQYGGSPAENQRQRTNVPGVMYRFVRKRVPVYHSTWVHWFAGQNTPGDALDGMPCLLFRFLGVEARVAAVIAKRWARGRRQMCDALSAFAALCSRTNQLFLKMRHVSSL